MDTLHDTHMSEDASEAARSADAPDPLYAPDPLESELTTSAFPERGEDRIEPEERAHKIPPIMARIPQVRIGKRWYSTLWILPIGAVLLVIAIAAAQELRTFPQVQAFIRRYPGTGAFIPPLYAGFPWWLRITHFLNLIFMIFIIRAGVQILADHPRLGIDSGSDPRRGWIRFRGPVPPDRMRQEPPERAWTAKDDAVALPGWLGLPGLRHTVGLARWWHFSFDLLWLINGVVFYVLLFVTPQWQRLVPRSWEVIPNAISVGLQYASLDFPANHGWTQYNGLQLLTYFITVFIVAPLALFTGLLQAPAIAAKFGLAWGTLNRQVARIVHFGVLCWMVFFIGVHTVMIWITGLLENLNHMTTGTDTRSWAGWWLYLAWMAVVVIVWFAATPLTIRYPRLVQRSGRFMVGWAKGLMDWWDPHTTYPERAISPFLWPNGKLPASDAEEYQRLRANGFRDYKLRIEGLVENPVVLSYEQLKAMPKHDEITQLYCIQGWSGIAKWGGVPMREIVSLVRPLPEAKWVVFYSFATGPEGGRYYDAHRIAHMGHESTILAYELNGEPVNVLHGAPIRLINELELGFKQVKWVEAIEFVASFEHLGAGQGGYNEDHDFYGYRETI